MILKLGAKGTEVANWQRFLIGEGASIEADGDFGTATQAATRKFQSDHGLTVDGEVGPNTLAKANPQTAIHASTTVRPTEIKTGKLAQVAPALASKVERIIALANSEGFTLQVSQGLRTFAEQDKLFKQRPKVTNARGGQSMHNYGLACDLVFIVDGKISWDDHLYHNIGKWASEAGLEWGGNWRTFRDLPHVQIPGLPSFRELLPIYNHGGIASVWAKYA